MIFQFIRRLISQKSYEESQSPATCRLSGFVEISEQLSNHLEEDLQRLIIYDQENTRMKG
jgi:hypothetical protein